MKCGMTLIAVLLGLNMPVVTVAEEITIGLEVNNVSPLLCEEEFVLTEEAIYISFLIEESNTLADIKKIQITIFEIGEKEVSIQKFTWEGVGKEWTPKPCDSVLPPLSQSRQKSFRFTLTIQRIQHGVVLVSIIVCDCGDNQSRCCWPHSFN